MQILRTIGAGTGARFRGHFLSAKKQKASALAFESLAFMKIPDLGSGIDLGRIQKGNRLELECYGGFYSLAIGELKPVLDVPLRGEFNFDQFVDSY